MLNNNVFNKNVNTVEWIKKSSIRAIKTIAQTAIGSIGASVVISSVDWKMVLSASLLSGVISLLTSIAGIPEVSESEVKDEV